MEKFATPGDFCPNETCTHFGKLQNGQQQNIEKIGKTKNGIQRFQCRICKGTFTETRGTNFYRRRTSEHESLETLAFLAEGSRISSLSRVKGFKEDTILAWLRHAAQHSEQLEELLYVQMVKLYTFVLSEAALAYHTVKRSKTFSRQPCCQRTS